MNRDSKAGRRSAPISRRTALKFIGLGATALPLYGCAQRIVTHLTTDHGDGPLVTADGRDFNPIDRTLGDVAPARFSGDDPERAHRVLWDLPGYLKQKGGHIPEPSERVRWWWAAAA